MLTLLFGFSVGTPGEGTVGTPAVGVLSIVGVPSTVGVPTTTAVGVPTTTVVGVSATTVVGVPTTTTVGPWTDGSVGTGTANGGGASCNDLNIGVGSYCPTVARTARSSNASIPRGIRACPPAQPGAPLRRPPAPSWCLLGANHLPRWSPGAVALVYSFVARRGAKKEQKTCCLCLRQTTLDRLSLLQARLFPPEEAHPQGRRVGFCKKQYISRRINLGIQNWQRLTRGVHCRDQFRGPGRLGRLGKSAAPRRNGLSARRRPPRICRWRCGRRCSRRVGVGAALLAQA